LVVCGQENAASKCADWQSTAIGFEKMKLSSDNFNCLVKYLLLADWLRLFYRPLTTGY